MLLAGCVTISPEAARVQLQRQNSTLLAPCQRLGNVNAAVAKTWSTGLAAEQADADLRDKVYRLGGDTLVILNTDYIERRAIVHGVAFNCGRSQ